MHARPTLGYHQDVVKGMMDSSEPFGEVESFINEATALDQDEKAALWLLAWSHRHVEAWLGSLITQCMPVVSYIAAWILLDESLTPLTVLGGLIVLVATAVILVRSRARRGGDPSDATETPAPAG